MDLIPSRQAAAGRHDDTPAVSTAPTPSRQQQWERHKDNLWGLWLRDRRPLKDVKTEMGRLGFHATDTEYKDQFKKWGFRQNVPAETWTYIGHHVRKRKPESSDVLVNGVHICPKRLCKRISPNQQNALALTKKVDPVCPPGFLVSICSLSAFTLELESLKPSWPAIMPWLQFSQRLADAGSGILTHASQHASAADGSLRRQQQSTSALQLVNRALPDHRALSDPSLLAAHLRSTMPEVYEGEHLRNSQLICGPQSDEATGLLLKLLFYRISNNSVIMGDKGIMDLVEHSGLMAMNLHRGHALLTATTTQSLLENFFGAALREIRLDITAWLLNLGVSTNTRHTIFTLHGVVSKTRHLPLLVTLEHTPIRGDCRWETIPADHPLMALKLLISHGATIDQYCCKHHGTALRYAVLEGKANAVLLFTETMPGRPNPARLSQQDYADLLCNMSWNEQAFQRIAERYAKAYDPLGDVLDLLMTTNGLLSASSKGSIELLQRLHDKGADFNCHNQRGVSPLLAAINRNLLSVVEALLRLGASANYYPGGAHGVLYFPPTPLHVAASKGSSRICQKLLNHGANIDALAAFQPDVQQPTHMWTALQSAIGYGEEDCAQFLLDHGASIQGDELLLAVANCSNLDIVSSLIEKGIDLEKMSASGETALQALCERGRVTNEPPWKISSVLLVIRDLVDAGASHNNEMDAVVGSSLLQESANDFCYSCVEYRNPDFERLFERLQWVVDHYPGAYSPRALFDLFFGVSYYLDDTHTRSQVLKLAQRLLSRRTPELVHLEHEAKAVAEGVKVYVQQPEPTLMDILLALSQPPSDENYARFPWEDPILRIADSILCPDNEEARDEDHWAVMGRLIDAGCMPTTLAGLRLFLDASAPQLAWLVAKGFNPRRRFTWSPTALQLAVEHHDIDGVKFLLKLGVYVNAAPPWSVEPYEIEDMRREEDIHPYKGFIGNFTALQQAVNTSDGDLVKLLIDHGADVNAAPAPISGATALQLAAAKGDNGVLKYLISLGADINSPGARFCGRTALEGAAEHGRIDTVSLLLSEGCQITGVGRYQYIRAVAFAQQEGHDALARLLQNEGRWTELDEVVLEVLDVGGDEEKVNRRWEDISPCDCGGDGCDDSRSVDDDMNAPHCLQDRLNALESRLGEPDVLTETGDILESWLNRSHPRVVAEV